MDSPIQGLHHVTATVDGAQADLDFCIEALGLRLVKKTVNFDNHLVYHFYYGDERGTPGTIWTTFPYKRSRRTGRRQGRRADHRDVVLRAGRFARFVEGAVAGARRGRAGRAAAVRRRSRSRASIHRAWRSSWSAPTAISGRRGRGIVDAERGDPRAAQRDDDDRVAGGDDRVHDGPAGLQGRRRSRGPHAAWRVNGDEPGKVIDIVHAPDAPRAMNGLGTVHHVAMAVAACGRAAADAGRAVAVWRQGHRGARSAVLPVDLLPRAGRRAVRDRDGAARVRRRRGRRRRSAAT